MEIYQSLALLRLEDFLELTPDAVVVVNQAQEILLFNPAAERLFGYSQDEIQGRSLSVLIPAHLAVAHSDHVRTFTNEPEAMRRMGAEREIFGRRKDQSDFPLEAGIAKINREGRLMFLVFLKDVTHQRRIELDLHRSTQFLEQRVAERTRELSALLEVSRYVASTMELGPLLRLILEQLKAVVDYSGAGVVMREGNRFVMLEYRGPDRRSARMDLKIPVHRAAGYRQVVELRGPLLIADQWAANRWARAVRQRPARPLEMTAAPARSWLGLPLFVKGRVVGLLRLDHPQPGHFQLEDAQMAAAFAEQAALAIEKARLYTQAQELAALEERQKLARELHDSVSQALYGIALGVRTARTLLDRDPAKAGEPLDYSLSLAEAGLAEMRALIFELRPESLESEGVVAALKKQAAALSARYAIQVDTDLGEEPQAPLAVKEAIYRVAQEAINNVVRHAQARRVEIRLERSGAALVLEVKDDGQGFDVSGSRPGHLGLNIMRERAARVGGTFRVESRPEGGTLIQVKMPV